MKDKTYYIVVDGETVRVRASKKPSRKTIDALKDLSKVIKEK